MARERRCGETSTIAPLSKTQIICSVILWCSDYLMPRASLNRDCLELVCLLFSDCLKTLFSLHAKMWATTPFSNWFFFNWHDLWPRLVVIEDERAAWHIFEINGHITNTPTSGNKFCNDNPVETMAHNTSAFPRLRLSSLDVRIHIPRNICVWMNNLYV